MATTQPSNPVVITIQQQQQQQRQFSQHAMEQAAGKDLFCEPAKTNITTTNNDHHTKLRSASLDAAWRDACEWLAQSLTQRGLDANLYTRCILAAFKAHTIENIEGDVSVDEEDDALQDNLFEILSSYEPDKCKLQPFVDDILGRMHHLLIATADCFGMSGVNESMDSGVCPSPDECSAFNQNYDQAFPPLNEVMDGPATQTQPLNIHSTLSSTDTTLSSAGATPSSLPFTRHWAEQSAVVNANNNGQLQPPSCQQQQQRPITSTKSAADCQFVIPKCSLSSTNKSILAGSCPPHLELGWCTGGQVKQQQAKPPTRTAAASVVVSSGSNVVFEGTEQRGASANSPCFLLPNVVKASECGVRAVGSSNSLSSSARRRTDSYNNNSVGWAAEFCLPRVDLPPVITAGTAGSNQAHVPITAATHFAPIREDERMNWAYPEPHEYHVDYMNGEQYFVLRSNTMNVPSPLQRESQAAAMPLKFKATQPEKQSQTHLSELNIDAVNNNPPPLSDYQASVVDWNGMMSAFSPPGASADDMATSDELDWPMHSTYSFWSGAGSDEPHQPLYARDADCLMGKGTSLTSPINVQQQVTEDADEEERLLSYVGSIALHSPLLCQGIDDQPNNNNNNDHQTKMF